MTYEGMYYLSKYLKENDIKLNKETREFVLGLDKIEFSKYVIFNYSLNIIKKFFIEDNRKSVITFLKNVINKEITEEKLLDCMDLIASQDTAEKQEQLRLACENDDIRNDKVALELIASQDTWEKQREVRWACHSAAIRNDEEALKLIISQDTWEKQREVRLACENDAIRNDKVALNLIASQDTAEKQEQVRLACENDAIREDKVVLELIASLDTAEEQEQLRLACVNDEIRNDKEALNSIIHQILKQKQVRLEYEAKIYSEKIALMAKENLDNSLKNLDLYIKTYENLAPKTKSLIFNENI